MEKVNNLHYFALVAIMLCCIMAHAQTEELEQPISTEENVDSGKLKNDTTIDVFKSLFVMRRKEHLTAVKRIKNLNKYEQRYKMVSIAIDQIVQTILEAKTNVIDNITSVEAPTMGTATLFSNATIRDALAGVLENTALFGDITLQLPEITHRILKKEKTWNATMSWSLSFAKDNEFLLDEPTIAMLELARQELNLIPRSPNFSNPWYDDKKMDSKKNVEKKKKTVKKGPQLARIDL